MNSMSFIKKKKNVENGKTQKKNKIIIIKYLFLIVEC